MSLSLATLTRTVTSFTRTTSSMISISISISINTIPKLHTQSTASPCVGFQSDWIGGLKWEIHVEPKAVKNEIEQTGNVPKEVSECLE
eukprot:15460528-Alexandrium_andersonii.AAC.1